MWGGSHGGCITLRALERGAQVLVAIDLFGPTDLAALDRFWRTNPSKYRPFLSVVEGAAGRNLRSGAGGVSGALAAVLPG